MVATYFDYAETHGFVLILKLGGNDEAAQGATKTAQNGQNPAFLKVAFLRFSPFKQFRR